MTKAAARPHPGSDASADLARTIEAVIADKSYGRYRQAVVASRPQGVAPTVTAATLMADLSAARQVSAAEPKPTKAQRTRAQAVAKPRSLLDRVFAYGSLGIVVMALLVLSPWGRDLLAPLARLLD